VGLRKLVVATAVLSLPFVAMSMPIGSDPAWATMTGTGIVNCWANTGSVATGSIKYSPSWSDSTSGAITATIKFTIKGCAGGSPAPVKIKGSGKVTFTPGLGQCSEAEETGGDGTLKLTYGPGIAPSRYSGFIAPDPAASSFPRLWSEFGGNVVTGSFPNSQAVPPFSDPEIAIEATSGIGNCTTGVTSTVLNASGGNAFVANI
jgi:hypothetical protein